MVKLTAQQQAYIAQTEAFYREYQLRPSTGRVLGYLLICEPSRQSEEAIAQALGLSVGSANNAVRLLTQIGLVTKIKEETTRYFYYEITPGIWQKLFEQRVQAGERAFALAKEGLKVSPGNARLQEMYDFYDMLGNQMKDLLNNLKGGKNNGTNQS